MKASSAKPPCLPWNREIVPGKSYWRAGLIVALLILVGQIVYFEGVTISRNPVFRSSLEKVCRQLSCQLPAYENLDELIVLQSSLSALPDRNRLFRATIGNRAAFAQPYPNVELTLLDYAGNPSARRIFRPRDYLPETQVGSSVQPDASTVISLSIATLKTKVGGYTFKLID
ncbi:DUF3426 domain-containing protein [Methylobacter sp.]|uniref:DUF3426 domain-containing protein n=1 Tax=Methylobacter sp. TaxID=2051955 RepID=UPI0012123645|nr:DUF3426 domain-containing protein [Methylobacter sp.]TAK65213.1 MAG: DUF3426 domain-containing protein [Methylobacter sp.]